MTKNTKLSLAIKLGILTSCLGLFNIAYAEDDKNVNKDEEEVEKIEVTGSRILREGAIAPSPVTIISGAQLVNAGVINIGEVLNDLPALANTYSLANSGRFIGTAGLNILDLRNMGTARTLVLVDGKRHVSSSAGTASVDTNTIPSEWIDRVEIITGGASAVYGADAVTGVVNFVLKKNIEGLSVKATAGFADNNPYDNKKFSLSYGSNFDNNRGNAAFSLEYATQNSLNALDNPWTATSYSSLKNQNQPEDSDSTEFPDKIYTPNAGYYAINNAGAYSTLPQWWANINNTFNRDGTQRDIFTGDNVDGIKCSDCDYFNLRQFTELQPTFDRYNANFKVNYDINDETNAYFSAKYSKTKAQDVGQPAFFFYKPQNWVSIDNPYMDQSVVDLLNESGADGIVVNRMMTDLGRRIEDDTRETQRYVAGITGVVANDWDYDASIVYGQTDLERVNSNNMVMANYYNALDAVRDDSGNIVCRSEEARSEGCAPVNIMGFGQPSQAAVDYINTVSRSTSVIKQTVIGGSIANSDLYELPAGSIGVAFGLEYRKEQSTTNEADNAEGTFFNVLGEDNGSFNVKEIFGEVSIPVISDVIGFKQLTVEAAVRYADYSTIGNATSWKLGLDWQVFDELRARSTYSTALRAPNISEIYGAESQTFFSIDDTCKSSELDYLQNSDTRRANCAALGVPTDFDSTYDSASIEGLSGGNRNLNAESSKSLTVGLIYQPEFIDGLSMTVDYWKIELTDAISATGAQDILNRCLDSETGIDNQYCALITRDSTTNEITLIKQYSLNLAGQDAAGIDFELGYDFDALYGQFSTTVIGTRLFERKEYPFQDDPTDFIENAGTTGEATWQTNLNVNYTSGAWRATWKTRYLQNVSLYTDQELADNPNPNSLMRFPGYVLSDMTIGYDFESGFGLTLGIDNVLNKELPFGTTGTGGGSAGYDNIGRFAYATLSYRM
jgi:iron complex outermembrane recepter protein